MPDDTPGKAAVNAALAAGTHTKADVDALINVYHEAEIRARRMRPVAQAAVPTIARVMRESANKLARIRDEARARGDHETADWIEARMEEGAHE